MDRLSLQPPDAEANQPPPLVGYNAWSRDPILAGAVEREGGGWIAERASRMGELVGSERLQTLAAQANRHLPELRTHDRFGNRIDAVEYHPAYHELMALAFGAGLHSLAWTEKRSSPPSGSRSCSPATMIRARCLLRRSARSRSAWR